MFLREYLYVDAHKVGGILSQVEEGIPETAKQVERVEKDAEARNRMLGGFGRKSIDESSIEKSLGDSLFKILEESLEAEGVLRDISLTLTDPPRSLNFTSRCALAPSYGLQRPGTLFHPGQLTEALVGIATAAQGTSQVLESHSDSDESAAGVNARKAERGKHSRILRRLAL